MPPLEVPRRAEACRTRRWCSMLRLNSADPGHVHGRHQRADLGLHDRRATRLRELAETPWRQHAAGHLRRAARPLREDDPRRPAHDPARAPTATSTTTTTTASISISVIRIEVAVTIRRRPIHLRFHGDEPAGARAVQRACPRARRPPPTSPLRAVTEPDASRTTAAASGPIALDLPEGSILNPRRAGARSAAAPRRSSASTGAILGALRGACRTGCAADAGRRDAGAAFRRPPAASGRHYVVGELIAAGSGAGPRSDGVDVIETDATNCMNMPAEAIEMEAPIRINATRAAPRLRRRRRQRGGLGIEREYEVLDGRDRHHLSRRAPFLPGGGRRRRRSRLSARTVIRRASGEEESRALQDRDAPASGRPAGDRDGRRRRLRRPAERSRDRVREDVENGKVSAEEARSARTDGLTASPSARRYQSANQQRRTT